MEAQVAGATASVELLMGLCHTLSQTWGHSSGRPSHPSGQRTRLFEGLGFVSQSPPAHLHFYDLSPEAIRTSTLQPAPCAAFLIDLTDSRLKGHSMKP